ncbi:MAG: ExeM/NucH family extracellular endonuclease, partial [Bowdeniella nasicola]|nr:ExeM/NucH family extracellular endonuclease [Bowdeniella nasicola]
MRLSRAMLAAVGAVALVLPALPEIPAQAAPVDSLIISEVYARGGSKNQPFKDKFVEIYNPTTTAIDLTGTSIQYRSAKGTAATNAVVPLQGSVAPGGVFVLAGGSNGANGETTPNVNQTGTAFNPGGSDGLVVLARSTAKVTLPTGDITGNADVIDAVGYGKSNTFEAAAATYTGSNSTPGALERATATDTNNNSVDFRFIDMPTPGSVSWKDSPAPDPSPTIPAPDPTTPQVPAVTIAEVQGTGAQSPLVGKQVEVSGVVTSTLLPRGDGMGGFYIMDPKATGPRMAGQASEGLFVYTNGQDLGGIARGDRVVLRGEVAEFYEMTQLQGVTLVSREAGEPLAPIPFPFTSDPAILEAYEGMLVAPEGNYVVTDNHNSSMTNYGQLRLAYGTEPIMHPGEVANPVTDPQAWKEQNEKIKTDTILLDDGTTTNFGKVTDKPQPYVEVDGSGRVGSEVTFKPEGVVLSYNFSNWNYQPLSPVDGADPATYPVTLESNRVDSVALKDAALRVATFNVLNYFTHLGQDEAGCKAYTDREGNPVTARRCNVRGAYTPEAFARQQEKIVAAIDQMNVEIVGLEEIESSTQVGGADRDEALAHLVDALNAKASHGTWAYVPSPKNVGKDDVIRTAFIYKPAYVKPVGESMILDDPAFDNARRPLLTKWEVIDEAAAGKTLTTVVNHFKSKGSGQDDGTNQGNANPDRVAQAKALEAWIAGQPDAQTEPYLLMGDFNAYTQEDPLQVFYAKGYTDLASNFLAAKTYVYGGTVGSLDHVLANKAALAQVQDTGVWNVNSRESVLLEYSRHNANIKQLYAPGPF